MKSDRSRTLSLPPRLAAMLLLALLTTASAQNALVLQSDFGTADGAVAAMKGVAHSVSATTPIYDLTHEIEPFNIWQAAALFQQPRPNRAGAQSREFR